MGQNSEDDLDSKEEAPIEISRRRFLKSVKYVPPTVFTVLISTSPVSAASPCTPDETCGPDDSCGPDF